MDIRDRYGYTVRNRRWRRRGRVVRRLDGRDDLRIGSSMVLTKARRRVSIGRGRHCVYGRGNAIRWVRCGNIVVAGIRRLCHWVERSLVRGGRR